MASLAQELRTIAKSRLRVDRSDSELILKAADQLDRIDAWHAEALRVDDEIQAEVERQGEVRQRVSPSVLKAKSGIYSLIDRLRQRL